MQNRPIQWTLVATLIVSALGYFVDVYDIVLFSVLRVPSLIDLGVSPEAVTQLGTELLRIQMWGILLGAFVWGVLGDKKGRTFVILGSILIYSIATLLNGLVQSVEQYRILRFIAGFGLAGELGAAITLVAEITPQAKRGYGTMAIAALGAAGAITAAWVGSVFPWRIVYISGGFAGLLLLLLRAQMKESTLFREILGREIPRGSLPFFIKSPKRVLRYLCCIVVGMPVWYAIGIHMTFAPELAQSLGVLDPITAGKAIFYYYLGFIFGDVSSCFLSQIFQSRKKIIGLFLFFSLVFVSFTHVWTDLSVSQFYGICLLIGFGSGYWVLMATMTSEQFGTNFRSTATTSAPQMLRATVIPMTLLLDLFRQSFPFSKSALFLGLGIFLLAGLSLIPLKETFNTHLDFLEH